MNTRYEARRASDKTEDWPFWMVVDLNTGVNVAGKLLERILDIDMKGAVLVPRWVAEKVAKVANEHD